MAMLGGFGRTGQDMLTGMPNPRGRSSHQRDFLDHMRHREPEAWHMFMDEYRGYNFNNMPMHELEGRFSDVLQHAQRYYKPPMAYGEMCQPPPHTKPKPKTWFEEIQAEVNEWLAGVS